MFDGLPPINTAAPARRLPATIACDFMESTDPLYRLRPIGFWRYQKRKLVEGLMDLLWQDLRFATKPLLIGPIRVTRQPDWHAWRVRIEMPVQPVEVQHHSVGMIVHQVVNDFGDEIRVGRRYSVWDRLRFLFTNRMQ